MTTGALVTIVGFGLAGEAIGESTFGWTQELVIGFIVLEVLGAELVLAQDLQIAVVMGVLVKGVVLQIIAEGVRYYV